VRRGEWERERKRRRENGERRQENGDRRRKNGDLSTTSNLSNPSKLSNENDRLRKLEN
jgi:hypothetical protein